MLLAVCALLTPHATAYVLTPDARLAGRVLPSAVRGPPPVVPTVPRTWRDADRRAVATTGDRTSLGMRDGPVVVVDRAGALVEGGGRADSAPSVRTVTLGSALAVAATAAAAAGYAAGRSGGTRARPRAFAVRRRAGRPLWRPPAVSARGSARGSGLPSSEPPDSPASAGSSSGPPRSGSAGGSAVLRRRLRSLAAGGSGGGGGAAGAHLPPPSWAAAAGAVADLVAAAGVSPADLGATERVHLVSAVVAAWRGYGAHAAAATRAALAADANAHLSTSAAAHRGLLAAARGRAASDAGGRAAASSASALADALAAGLALQTAVALGAGAVRAPAACAGASAALAGAATGWGPFAVPRAVGATLVLTACRAAAVGRALIGGGVLLFAARAAARAGLASSAAAPAAPLTRLVLGLGAAGGIAGALGVRALGGDVRVWSVLWAAWISAHAVAAVARPRAAARAAARAARRGRSEVGRITPSVLALYTLLAVALPLAAGGLPFWVAARVRASDTAAFAAVDPPPRQPPPLPTAVTSVAHLAKSTARGAFASAAGFLPHALAAARGVARGARRRAATAADALAARAAAAAAAAA